MGKPEDGIGKYQKRRKKLPRKEIGPKNLQNGFKKSKNVCRARKQKHCGSVATSFQHRFLTQMVIRLIAKDTAKTPTL